MSGDGHTNGHPWRPTSCDPCQLAPTLAPKHAPNLAPECAPALALKLAPKSDRLSQLFLLIMSNFLNLHSDMHVGPTRQYTCKYKHFLCTAPGALE